MATAKYTLPAGKIYFDDGTGEEYIGNTTAFTIDVTVNSLEHYSNDTALGELDGSVDTQTDRKGSLTTDQISTANLARYVRGTTSTQTQTSQTAVNSTIIAKIGRSYQLGATAANPSGVRKVANVVVKKGAVTLIAGTDYTVDLTLARITVLAGGAIGDGDSIAVTYDVAAATRSQVVALSGTSIIAAVRYISDNKAGDNLDYYMPYVKISPNGSLDLKGSDWQKIQFNMMIMKKDDATAPIYIDGRPV